MSETGYGENPKRNRATKSTFYKLNNKLLRGLRRGGLLAGQIGGDAPTGSGLAELGLVGLTGVIVARIEVRGMMVEAVLAGVEGAGDWGLGPGLLHGRVEWGAGAGDSGAAGRRGGRGAGAGDGALSGVRHQRVASTLKRALNMREN